MSNAAPTQQPLDQKVVNTIKTANLLLSEYETELSSVSTKLASQAKDIDAANERLVGLIDKLAAERVNNTQLIEPDMKDRYLDAVQSSKHACVDLMEELFGLLQKTASTGKTAGEGVLGAPSDDVDPYADADRQVSGFGSLRSKNIRM